MNGVKFIQRERELHVGVVAEGEHLSGLSQHLQSKRFRKVAVNVSIAIAEIEDRFKLESSTNLTIPGLMIRLIMHRLHGKHLVKHIFSI